ncbi:thioesterase family protein [Williamsia sp. CHRR-6]|nr:thioesterase family protein [Williamsia sp. CHRR-6]
MQHGGPPSGLLARAIESVAPSGLAVSRMTIDILGPVGLSENRIRARVIRPGRQICQAQAELDVLGADGSFRVAARATAWLLATSDTSDIALPAASVNSTPTLDTPAMVPPEWRGMGWLTDGFIAGLQFHRGPNPDGVTWVRTTSPLVEDEDPSALQRFCCVVDVANGLGSGLSVRDWTWMNTDTTIHLLGSPAGDWFGIDATLQAGAAGFGYTAADLFDQTGLIGRSSQTVLLARRS